jgi:hypothetical protein
VAVAMAGPWPPTFLASCFIHFCSFLGRCCDALAANRPCQDLWHRGLCSLRQRCQVANYAEKFKLAKNRPYLTSFHSWPPVHWKRNLKMTPDWPECDWLECRRGQTARPRLVSRRGCHADCAPLARHSPTYLSYLWPSSWACKIMLATILRNSVCLLL